MVKTFQHNDRVMLTGNYQAWGDVQGTVTHLHGDNGYTAIKGTSQVWVMLDKAIPMWSDEPPVDACWIEVECLIKL